MNGGQSEDNAAPQPDRSVKTCRAAVFHAAGQELEISQVALPARLEAGELLVRVTCCTLCGSDLHTLSGARKEATPCILGHEITGTVAEVGPTPTYDLYGRRLQVGDRVIWSVATSCDQCSRCTSGHPQKCHQLKKYGHQQVTSEWILSGGLAQYCHLTKGTKLIVANESDLPDDVLALTSCAIATTSAAVRIAAANVAAEDFQGKRVLVLGAGMLGLTACAMFRSQGATDITACEISPQRLELAGKFGASNTIEPSALEESAKRFDVVLEMSGALGAVAAALTFAGVGSVVLLVGSVLPAGDIAIDPESIVRRLLTIRGVHNYGPQDLAAAYEFLRDRHKQFPFAELVAASYQLWQVNEAFRCAQETRPIRIAVRP